MRKIFAAIAVAAAAAIVYSGQYEIYPGTPFVIVHETQLGQFVADTVYVLSKTEHDNGNIPLRTVHGDKREIVAPDYIIEVKR